jgi:hypothetical protein
MLQERRIRRPVLAADDREGPSIFASVGDVADPAEAEMDRRFDEETEEKTERRALADEPYQHQRSLGAKEVEESVGSDLRFRAHRVAQLKMGFYRMIITLVLANIALFLIAFFEVQPVGKAWFVWPLGFSVLAILVKYLRAFVLRGKSLQGYIEALEHRIEEREYIRQNR